VLPPAAASRAGSRRRRGRHQLPLALDTHVVVVHGWPGRARVRTAGCVVVLLRGPPSGRARAPIRWCVAGRAACMSTCTCSSPPRPVLRCTRPLRPPATSSLPPLGSRHSALARLMGVIWSGGGGSSPSRPELKSCAGRVPFPCVSVWAVTRRGASRPCWPCLVTFF